MATVGEFREMLKDKKDEDLVSVEMIPNFKINIVAAPEAVKEAEVVPTEEKAADSIEAKVD